MTTPTKHSPHCAALAAASPVRTNRTDSPGKSRGRRANPNVLTSINPIPHERTSLASSVNEDLRLTLAGLYVAGIDDDLRRSHAEVSPEQLKMWQQYRLRRGMSVAIETEATA